MPALPIQYGGWHVLQGSRLPACLNMSRLCRAPMQTAAEDGTGCTCAAGSYKAGSNSTAALASAGTCLACPQVSLQWPAALQPAAASGMLCNERWHADSAACKDACKLQVLWPVTLAQQRMFMHRAPLSVAQYAVQPAGPGGLHDGPVLCWLRLSQWQRH